MQIFLRSQTGRPALWQDYLAVCRLGGSVDFLDLLAAGHLESPFDPDVVGRTLAGIQADIAAIDPAALR